MSSNQGSVSFDYLFKNTFVSPLQRETIKKGSLASLFSFGKKETNSVPTSQNTYASTFSKDSKRIEIKTSSITQSHQIKRQLEKQLVTKQTSKRLQIEVKAESLVENPKPKTQAIVIPKNGRSVGKKTISNHAFCGFVQEEEEEEIVETKKKKIKIEKQPENERKKISSNEHIENEKCETSKHKMEEEKLEIEGKQRIENLIKSMSDLIADSQAQMAPTKLRKKSLNPLIKFLLSSRYHEQKPSLLATTVVDNEFDNYDDYQKAFQPLMLNEYLSSVHASIKSLINEKSDAKPISHKITIATNDQTEEDGFIVLDIKRTNQSGKTTPMLNLQANGTADFSDANNYLVLISSSKDVRAELVNNSQSGQFAIVGYLSSAGNSKIGSSDFQRISIAKQFLSPRISQHGWTFCYIRLIDKVTTFVREYNSLSSLAFSETNQYLFRPRNASILLNAENPLFYHKFFDKQKFSYNDCQLKVMKNICLSANKICLLQGPPGTGKTHTLIGLVSGLFHYIKTFHKSSKRYIMICAPSNAAIDEIILRILQFGINNEDGESIIPNVVKVGVLDREAPELVKKHTLENLAQEKIQQTKIDSLLKEETLGNQLRAEIERISQRIEKLAQDANKNASLIKTLDEEKKKLEEQYQKFCKHCASEKNYKQIIQNILHSADIICCTLTSAGSEKLSCMKGLFEALIVDEASQCTEPSNVIPFQYLPKKIILIGDPRQLPPTTFCANANTTKFNRSLFERIIDCGVQPDFLCEQYRMVPSIRQFPSMNFYEDRLVDSFFVQNRDFPSYLKDFERQNVLFLDLKFSQEKEIEHSFYNESEIEACIQILGLLLQKLNQSMRKYRNGIGCISPYKRQVNILNEKLREKYGDGYKDHIIANTVDAFQGQEKDIIVLSTVRANPKIYSTFDEQNFIGFLSDMRRLNVAITRPKFVLIVIGNSNTLATNATWRSYINHLVQNKSYFSIPEVTRVDEIVQLILKNENIPAHLTEPPGTLKMTPPKYNRQWENKNAFNNSADQASTRESSSNVSPVSPFKITMGSGQKEFTTNFGYKIHGASWVPNVKPPPPPTGLDFNFRTSQNESLTAKKNILEGAVRLESEVIYENKEFFAKSSRLLFQEDIYHSNANNFEHTKLGLPIKRTPEKINSDYLEGIKVYAKMSLMNSDGKFPMYRYVLFIYLYTLVNKSKRHSIFHFYSKKSY